MAIEVSSTDIFTQYTSFSTNSVYGLDDKTIDAVIYLNNNTESFSVLFANGLSSSTDEIFRFDIASGKVRFGQWFSGGTPNPSYWDTNNTISSGYHRITVTYNKTSNLNNPVFYVDGSLVSSTDVFRNTGTATTGVSNLVLVNVNISSTLHRTHSICVYNRILTAAEIADAYNSRLAIPNYNGLVFAPNLCGAAGLQTFDGATLGSTNYLKDMVSGATGTPNGSPIGRADTYLNWK